MFIVREVAASEDRPLKGDGFVKFCEFGLFCCCFSRNVVPSNNLRSRSRHLYSGRENFRVSAPVPITRQAAPVRSSNRPARPRLREITLDDFSAIASFTERFGFDPLRSREEWEHLYIGNPANIASEMRCAIGWILELDGQMIGHIASVPTLYHLGDRQLLAASGRAWAVLEEYRGYGSLMLHTYLNQPGVDFAITNTANAVSWHVHSSLGAKVVPVGRFDISPAWITRHTDVIADVLARKKNIRPPRMLFYPVAAALAAKDNWNRLQVRLRARQDVEVAVQFGFDQRFEDFWERLRARYPQKLLADRSLPVLQWHFKYAMAEGRFWVATASRDQQLLGYAIFVRDSYRTAGSSIRRAVLADYQSLEADDALYFALLQSGLEKCRRDGIALLVVNGFSASGTDVSKFAPYHRKLEAPRFLYKAADPELARRLDAPEVWCPSSFDADDTL